MVCLDPCVAHHVVFLVIERIENLHGIKSAHSFNPDILYRAVEGNDAPVGSLVGDYCAEIVFAVHKLYAGLDIVLAVETYHHSCLVKSHLVVAGYFNLSLELSAIFGVIERSIIDSESVMGYAPIVTVGSDIHCQCVTADMPAVRLIEPIHLFEGLGIHIIAGGFARNLDIGDYEQENSIWESKILSLMSQEEQEEKYIAELRFFHYLRHLPKSKRADYYLMSKLRFCFADGGIHDVLHRMYYIFDDNGEDLRYAICIYGPLPFDFKGKSFAVNSVRGIKEELTASGNDSILSRRERQILAMIDTGMKSAEIAGQLNISIHTVSRHRQEIIGKLQVKNTHEACRLAKSMDLF